MMLQDVDLAKNYQTYCDPRLNYEQSLDIGECLFSVSFESTLKANKQISTAFMIAKNLLSHEIPVPSEDIGEL